MVCPEAREVVLSFKEPLELLKWRPEFAERLSYLGPAPQNSQASIYINIDIDTIWVQTFKDDWVTVSEALVAIGWIPEVKRIIVPKANPMGMQMLSSIMPNEHNRYNSIIYPWALSFNLEEIYYLLGDDDFSFDDKGIELPHLLDGYIDRAYPRTFSAERLPRSLEEIEGYEKGFDYARNRGIEQCWESNPIITGIVVHFPNISALNMTNIMYQTNFTINTSHWQSSGYRPGNRPRSST
ncbi:a042805f-f2fc-4a17-ba1d-e67f9153d9cd [Sclerotinia trifoliorum]|uniref:A042805f-f2fc-4a17-ba1d-e67f9153d9cd n=1 Tax=Sclerotinia trifoliorum TaxID=28548 RepID=A0A8H2ZMG5_9HELO|nr:a042805f-f2fc-4a17-ba1d-e67f9153d9cd [Sclerotinia trifoliorum]